MLKLNRELFQPYPPYLEDPEFKTVRRPAFDWVPNWLESLNWSLLGGFVKTGSATKDFLGWEARGGCLEDPEFKFKLTFPSKSVEDSLPPSDWAPNWLESLNWSLLGGFVKTGSEFKTVSLPTSDWGPNGLESLNFWKQRKNLIASTVYWSSTTWLKTSPM